MFPDLPHSLPLICPCCRRLSERGWELFTLRIDRVTRTSADDEVEEGSLACDNPSCDARFPIIDGIPIVLADLGGFLQTEIASVIEADLHPETVALLVAGGPDGAYFPRLAEHLSLYVDAHWGDRATPVPDGPAGPFGLAALATRLGDRRSAPVSRALELGCSVGRGLAELACGAAIVVGIDLHFGALRRARRLLAGNALSYARRAVGRRYQVASASAGDLAAPTVTLICGDALDPPIAPASFQRVVALNVMDSVRTPAGVVNVVDKVCAPGGEVLLSSPFSWQSGIVDEDARFGGDDPPAALASLLREGRGLDGKYVIEDEADLPWSLRRDGRSAHTYVTRYLRARRSR